MKQFLCGFVLLCLLGLESLAQSQGAALCAKYKAEALGRQFRNARVAYPGDPGIDVKYHHLDLSVVYQSRYLSGNVRTDFVTLKDNFSSCSFDLHASMTVDSVRMGNDRVAFTRSGNKIILNFARSYPKGERISVNIYYRGNPRTSAFGSFSFGTHSGAPVVWSLSEPYGAPDWWPCKDDPSDKIDSARVWITMPSGFVSVSNGVLTGKTDHSDGTSTYKWFSRYPVAHYLISLASSNYTEYTRYWKYTESDSMRISHFIYPEVLTNNLRSQLNETERMLDFFSSVFGRYPFVEEKYGHAMCGFGGGMEHQTVSSMGGFNQDLIVHELAHQWFGDMINCKTWADIWVNEGFASYSEALYAEHKSGRATYELYMDDYITLAKRATGTVSIQNPEDENQIFNYNRTYAKGAVVLHMLRGILGDEMFFRVLKDYAASEFAYGAAGIDDFRKVAERTSGKDLGYFFSQWLYGESYPRYQFGWAAQGQGTVKLRISQTRLSASPSYFSMPVDLKISLENGRDTLVTVFTEGAEQEFTISGLPSVVKSVVFDPSRKIMKELTLTDVISGLEEQEEILIYPNPADKVLYLKDFSGKDTDFEITDLLGRTVLRGKTGGRSSIDISSLSSGKYILRLGERTSRRVLVR